MSPRRQRINHIRRTVAVGAASLFLALFAGVAIQMETGHDPALGAQSTSTAATTGGGDDGGSAATDSSATTLAPATTSQS